MTTYALHTRASAPYESKPFLEQAATTLGHIPPLLAQMAESPALVEGYASLSAIFRKSAFTATEQQLALLTLSVEHGAHYCTPAHSLRAREAGLDEADIRSIRDRRPLPDPRREALRRFCILMVRERGFVSDADIEAFLAQGFTKAQVLDVVLAVGLKTLANYVNHIAETPLSAALAAEAAKAA